MTPSGAGSEPGAPSPVGWGRLRALLPHVATAAVAVAITLLLQRVIPPVSPVAPLVTPAPSAAPTVVAPTPGATNNPVPSPEVTPSPTEPPLAAAISRQELIDLRAQDDRLWAAIYLIRALNQIADAESALLTNDLASVEQTLSALDETLAQAYARAADPDRAPIDQIRRDVGVMREDLYPRPEGMDARFARLRQAILTLIESRR